MVKPPLRTKSIGFKVSEQEYAQLETAAQTSGRTLGEWCREVILRGKRGTDGTFPSEPSKPSKPPSMRPTTMAAKSLRLIRFGPIEFE
jgi:hypothetical protein